MESSCQNIFCGECFLKWQQTNNTCPLCRNTTIPENLIYIKTEDVDKKQLLDKKEIKKTKKDHLYDIISQKGQFLIFSEWNETFYAIRHIISDFSYAELKGSINQRSKIIQDFKQGHIKILFLNSKNDGSGLNLQEVTDIIIYHQMDNRTQTQIIGRANRIGRKIPLNIHHLVNTI
jgi:SNF2 family DNA or RNA helicase